ncbi:hypothetical protein B5P22_31110 [Pseudomonas tolaasii]|uniref:hypothetical protein n=1 Tax=Pseudomonas tolaasii TaxID=29442 RepID=UPI0009B67CC4|nr:hypothetical protein [Pseudomonas tolaasii]ARB31557.1 hypothetical protein B5P22_31110 [Pseudomonas tolaasii]
MSTALDKKLRRKANRQLAKAGERLLTKAQQDRCTAKAKAICERVKQADDKSLSLGERSAAKAANRRLSDTWDKREPGNTKAWFNPTGKRFVNY